MSDRPPSTTARVVGLVSSVGMTVFFGCLVAYGGPNDAPPWLVWPAGVAMWVGLPLSWYLHRREAQLLARRRSTSR